MKTLLSRAALAAAAIALGLSSAQATTANGNLSVNLILTSACTVTGSSINFGSQSALLSTIPAQSYIYVTCTAGTPYSVTLGPGLHPTSRGGRIMTGTGSNTVSYDLYTDTPGGTSWSGNTAVSRMGSGGQDSIPVFGQATPTSANTDTYSDTVQITVTY